MIRQSYEWKETSLPPPPSTGEKHITVSTMRQASSLFSSILISFHFFLQLLFSFLYLFKFSFYFLPSFRLFSLLPNNRFFLIPKSFTVFISIFYSSIYSLLLGFLQLFAFFFFFFLSLAHRYVSFLFSLFHQFQFCLSAWMSVCICVCLSVYTLAVTSHRNVPQLTLTI